MRRKHEILPILRRVLFAILFYAGLPAVIVAEEAKNGSLYRDLGGGEGIARFVAAAVASAHSHPKIAVLFEDADDENLRQQLEDKICTLAGGPCTYEGLDMQEAHSGMEITEAEFDIFVELVIDAMEDAGIPHSARNRLLARLAPLREDVIYQ
jgi:hemoglobin